MSRYRKTGAEYSIAFGVDHALGVFVMVWNHTEYDDPDPENLVVDEDKFSVIVTCARIKNWQANIISLLQRPRSWTF